jgi:hypothetical protein
VENKGSERREEEEDFSLLECPAQHFSLGQEVHLLDPWFTVELWSLILRPCLPPRLR